jgi:hypothetical protein
MPKQKEKRTEIVTTRGEKKEPPIRVSRDAAEAEEIEAFGTHTVVQEWSIGIDNHDECDEPGCDAGICVGVRLEPSEEQREAGARHLELNLDQAEAEDFADSLAQMMHEAWPPAAHAGPRALPTAERSETSTAIVCRKCFEERPKGMSTRDYAWIDVYWTEVGIQVWCVRHEVNLIHVDFEGARHPATSGPGETKAALDS